MAGAISSVTAKMAPWLLVTVAAAGLAGPSSPFENQKDDSITRLTVDPSKTSRL
jgi:hypothetical protein